MTSKEERRRALRSFGQKPVNFLAQLADQERRIAGRADRAAVRAVLQSEWSNGRIAAFARIHDIADKGPCAVQMGPSRETNLFQSGGTGGIALRYNDGPGGCGSR